jgi:hypothetical protein
MANIITIDSESYDGRYLRLTCGQEQDVANNRSIIHWTLYSLGGDVNYYSTGPTSVKINGTEVYAKARVAWDLHAFPAAKGQVSGTITVPHNDDGNKTITVSLSTAIYYTVVKAKTANWELDPIALKATLVDSPNFTDSELPTITYVNPRGNDVTTLEACIADSAGWSAYVPYRDLDKTGTSYTFTAEDISLLKEKASGSTLVIWFIIRTVVDGKTYTDYQVRSFTMTNNDDTRPVVSFTHSPDNPSSFASSVAGLYIQGKTRVKATITPQLKYGATVSNYTLYVGGLTKISTEATITSDVLSTNGDNVALTASVKDSRGFTGTATKSIKVYTYSKPLVEPLEGESAVLCYRSDKSGEAEFVCVEAKMSYSSLDTKNRCTLQWRQKLSTEAWDDSKHDWEDLIARTDNTKEYSSLVKKDGVAIVFEKTKSYSIQIKAIDDVGEFDIKDFEIPTEDVALHLGRGGKNVSIGEYCDYAEERTFRSAWKAVFDNGIYGNLYGNLNGTMTQQSALGDMLAFAEECPQGFTPFFTGESTTNVPATGNYLYASGFVCKRSDTQITVVIFSYYSGDLAINTYYDTAGGWLGWRYLKTTTS